VATGLKVSRPDLEVWVVTGDGDALSIGGNHLIHVLRRNVGIKILMFNNRIYGLTKGQYSPTSEMGKRTKSTPLGSVDNPFNPLAVALGAGATFVARSVDIFQAHLKDVLRQAAAHRGTAFVEIYQNCNIFNDKAFSNVTDGEARKEDALYLEHGKPLIYGQEHRRGVRLRDGELQTFTLENEQDEAECLVWDESRPSSTLAFAMSQLLPPLGPTPLGIFRSVEAPAYEDGVVQQIQEQIKAKGDGKLENLLYSKDSWKVS
jgi:2-oxoglutarate ferredoxin oxidoreductase subunit beta